ncbi:MAG TPA: ATP-binding protein [Trichocoleus sp.]
MSIEYLVGSNLTFVKRQAHQKGIDLNAAVPVDIGMIQADDRQIRQVLINLLSNAIKFTLEKGNVTAVEVAKSLPELMVHFKVIDTGIGIAAKHLGKLSQSFV